MCLDYAKTKDIPQYKEGYKVFSKYRKGNTWQLIGCHRSLFVFKKRRWMVDEANKLIISPRRNYTESHYKTGFHCFLFKEDAVRYAESDEVVHRVLTKEITATGMQGKYPAFAARQIFLMEEIPKGNSKGSIS